MKLYPKRLHSVGSLEREKKKLKAKSDELNKENIFSFAGIIPGAGKGKKEAPDNTNSAAPNSFQRGITIANIALPLLKRFIGKKKGNAAPAKPKESMGLKAGKVAFKAIREFGGGYLKWKAAELAIKGISHLIKSRNKKTAAAAPIK